MEEHFTPPQRRRFGTLLSANSPTRSERRKVRVRRTSTHQQKHHSPSSATVVKQQGHHNHTNDNANTNTDNNNPYTYTVTFEAGIERLGLHLEPFTIPSTSASASNTTNSSTSTSRERTGCRVQQFSDGGPSAPGAARVKGCISPGDIIVQVNGHVIMSYEQAIALLKESVQGPRVLVFQSALENKTSYHLHSPTDKQSHRPPSHPKTESNKMTTITPTRRHSYTSTSPVASPSEESIDISLIQTADDLVLLSNNGRFRHNRDRSNRDDRPSSLSPAMTRNMIAASPHDVTNHRDRDDSMVVPLEDMLQHDFGMTAWENSNILQIQQPQQRSPKTTRHDWDTTESPQQQNENQLLSLKQELKDCQSELEGYQQQLLQVKKEQHSHQQKWLVEKQSLQEEVGFYKQRSNQLEGLNQEMKEEHDRFRDASVKERLSMEQQRLEEKESLENERNSYKRQAADLEQNKKEAAHQHEQVIKEVTTNLQALHQKKWQEEKESLIQELRFYKQQCTDLAEQQERCQRLDTQKLSQVEQELEQSRQLLLQRQSVIDKTRLERDGALRTVQQKTQFASELARKLEGERADAKQLQESLEAQVNSLQSEFAQARKERDRANESIRNLEGKLAEVVAQRDGFDEARQEERIQALEMQNELEKELLQTRATMQEIQKQTSTAQESSKSIVEVEANARQLEKKLIEVKETLQFERKSFEQRQRELENALESVRAERVRLKENEICTADIICGLKNTLRDEKAHYAATQQNYIERLHTSDGKLAESLSKLSTAEKSVSQSKDSILCLESQLRESQSQLKEERLSKERYKEELEQIRETIGKDDLQRQSLLKDLTDQLRNAESESMGLHLSLDQQVEETDILKSKLNERETQLSCLRDILFETRNKLKCIQNSVTDAEKLKTQYDELERTSHQENNDLESLCLENKLIIDQLSQEWEKMRESARQQSEENVQQVKENDLLKKDIDKLESRIDYLLTEIKLREDELEEATNMLDLTESKLRSTEEELTSQLREKQAIDDINSSAQSELARLRMQMSDLKRSLEEHKSRLECVVREKQDIGNFHAASLEKLDRLEAMLDESSLAVSQKASEMLSLQASLDDAKAELDLRSEELSTCQLLLTRVRSERDALAEKVASKVDVSVNDSDSLAEELIETQNELSEMRKRNTELDRLLRSMRRNISDSERRSASARLQLDTERQTTRDLKNQLHSIEKGMQEKLDDAVTENRKLRQENFQLGEDRNRLDRLSSRTRQENEEVRKNIESLLTSHESKMKQVEKERIDFIEQSTRQKKEICYLSERLKAAKAESETLHREMSDLRRNVADEIISIKEVYDAKISKLNDLVQAKDHDIRKLNKVTDEIRIVRGELSQTQESLKRARDECDLLSSLLDEVREDCSSKLEDLKESNKLELDRLKEENHETEGALRRVRTNLGSTQEQLRASQESLSKANDDREKLRKEKSNIEEKLASVQDNLADKSAELDLLKSQLEDSFEGDESPFQALSRRQLREKCEDLISNAESLQRRLSHSENMLAKEKLQCQELSEQWSDLSEETDKLSGTLRRTQAELEGANRAREDALVALREEKEHRSCLDETICATREQLAQSEEEARSLQNQVNTLHLKAQQMSKEKDDTVSSFESQLADLQSRLADAEETLRKKSDDVRTLRTTVSLLKQELLDIGNTLQSTQSEYDDLQRLYDECIIEKETLGKDIAKLTDEFTTTIAQKDAERDGLRKSLSEMEIIVQNKEEEVRGKSQQIDHLMIQIGRSANELTSVASERDDARSSLTEAMQQSKSYREAIKELECKISDSERERASHTSQLKDLRETIAKLEESSDASLELRSKQLQESEAKCSGLEHDRDQLAQTASSLRDELREARRQFSEQDRLIASLRSRASNLSDALEVGRAEVKSAASAKDEAHASRERIEEELKNKIRDFDHLRAKNQVLNATITRMKSDYALLEDIASRADSKTAPAYDSRDDSIARLQSNVQSLEGKLSSLSEVYKSQQQVLSLSQNLEGQLMHFVEDVLHRTGDSIFGISSHLSKIEENCSLLLTDKNSMQKICLDSQLLSTIDLTAKELSSDIAHAKSMLDEKHEQLDAWKRRRSLRVAPEASMCQTPDAKPKSHPDSPSVLQALEKMKQVLNDEILTPYKNQPTPSPALDSEYLQKVIAALESQIDALLSDLQFANENLKAKDQLFHDLEQLVAHHESERDILERKLERTQNLLQEAEAKTTRVTESPSSTGMTVETAHSVTDTNDVSIAQCKFLAGRMIAAFVENRDTRKKSSAFRQWTLSSTWCRAATHHEYTEALALELDTMREKFQILKKHLKKSRRGKVGISSGLDSIIEDNLAELSSEEDHQSHE